MSYPPRASLNMNQDRSWFWNEGYRDGLEGRRWIVPDETRHQWQRSDYAAGYDAGQEDRAANDETVELRIVPCERCGGDGGWSVESTFDPSTGRIGYRDIECTGCGGSGEIEVEFRSLTLDDLDDIE